MVKRARIYAILPNKSKMKFVVGELPIIGRSDYHIKVINDTYSKIDLSSIENYVVTLKKARKHKLSSIRTFCNDIRTCYRIALGESYNLDDHVRIEFKRLFDRITPVEGAGVSTRPLVTFEEFSSLITLGNRKYACMIRLLGFTAIRITESSLIRNKDIQDLHDGDSAVYIYGKGAKERTVPVPTDIITQIRDEWNSHDEPYLLSRFVGGNDPLNRRTLSWKIRQHSRRLIGRSTSPHDYRAFFGTNAYEESPEKLKEIMALMGIASVEVFMRHYKKLRPLRPQTEFEFLARAPGVTRGIRGAA